MSAGLQVSLSKQSQLKMTGWETLCSLRGRCKKGRERGREKSTKEGKGKGALPLSPLPPSFSLFPYPLPLSTPATQVNPLS